MKASGTLICARCLREYDVSGTIEQVILPDGTLAHDFQPDIASTAILQAHHCQPEGL